MNQDQYDELKQQLKRTQEMVSGLANRVNENSGRFAATENVNEDIIWIFLKRFFNWIKNPKAVKESIINHRIGIISILSIAVLVTVIYTAYATLYLSHHGLVGNYYSDTKFSTLVGRRLDPKIDFKWRLTTPMEGLSVVNFSVRWKGFFKADESGSYIFSTISDDGVRLWIDDALIFENWTVHGDTLDSSAVTLDKGFHKIELEYYQGYGSNTLRLFFQKPSDHNRRIIPPAYLYPKIPSANQ